jgi:hypothetical protein
MVARQTQGADRSAMDRLEQITDANEIHELITTTYEKVKTDPSGWVSIYRNLSTGDLWELSYPHGERHGGGPPIFRKLGT